MDRPQPKEYTETHHILPRSLGGSDEHINLLSLSGREHYLAHWMLWKAYKNHSMTSAFIMMHTHNKKQKRIYNSKIYERAKMEYAKIQSIRLLGGGNPFFEKKHTEEAKRKMSESKKGINCSWNTGLTKATSEKLASVGKSISKASKGMRHWTNGIDEMKSFESPGSDWVIGRLPNENYKHSEERRLQIKESMRDGKMTWWNNGVINKRGKTIPDGENWVAGRLMSPELYEKFCKKTK